MRNKVQFIFGCILMFLVGWFVSFQYSPYNVCDDHPDPKMTEGFYKCEPFGFTLHKDSIIQPRRNNFPWERNGKHVYKKRSLRKGPDSSNRKRKERSVSKECYELLKDSNIRNKEIPPRCLNSLDELDI